MIAPIIIFKGIDEGSSVRRREARTAQAVAWQRPQLSEDDKQRAAKALRGGELDELIDALFVSCPLCGHRLEAQERYFVDHSSGRVFQWQVGSEHYVLEHNLMNSDLMLLIRAMGIE